MAAILWSPDAQRVASSQWTAFRQSCEARGGGRLPDSAALHAFSVHQPATFWDAVWELTGVLGERGPGPAVVDLEAMPGARFFPHSRLSFAENLLRRRDAAPALIARDESGRRRELSHAALHDQVARLSCAFRSRGLKPGDRVAAFMPNVPETVVIMLAAASVGATFASCSPDFGVRGVLDRFGQIEPRWLFTADGYRYGGKSFDSLAKARQIADALPSLEQRVVVANLSDEPSTAPLEAVSYGDLLRDHPAAEVEPLRLPFDHPLYILFSSGTTGKPKCIVHGAGGTLLQHLKEHRLHTDVRAGERLFYFTTCGWMMWNWLASGLASEATLVLYDGSPFHPSGHALFQMAEEEGIDVFGTSAKFLDAVAKAGLVPGESHDLSRIRTLLSTGSPLAPESFDYVYRAIGRDLQLASISGGTDIVSCFVLGDPTRPVRRGQIQGPGLGMDVKVFDPKGQPVVGEMGELVCTTPFPSMPLGFWNDPDGSRYRRAYFERFPGAWCHGDFCMQTPEGGFVITGRSDTVLNPGGVRIGTAEIYRPVEQLDEVLEAVAIGQPHAGDVRVVLFVRLAEGLTLDDDLRQRLRRAVREHASPRHVPAVVLQVRDIPRTRSGKISELSVRNAVLGRRVENVEALANPEALAEFQGRAELEG